MNNSVAPANFQITLSANPKEITCVGALNSGINSSILDNRIIYWPGGNLENNYLGEISENNGNIKEGLTYSDVLNSDDYKMQINNSLSEFFEVFDTYVAHSSLLNSFDISDDSFIRFKELRDLNLMNYLEYGIKANNKRDGQRVEETLFFFPLIGLLNSLSFELAQME